MRQERQRVLATAVLVAVALSASGVVAPGTADTAATADGTRALTSACASAPTSRFPDRAEAGVHAGAIDCVAWWNVTRGLPDGTFQPRGTVTRGQMATFLTNAILAAGGQLPPPDGGFQDTGATVHRRAIARLAAAGIVGGFPDGTYRPGQAVTRGQMATFLIGALEHLAVEPPPVATDAPIESFLDVPGTTHEARIVLAARVGIAGGFNDGTYRPGEPVARMQMATFLARLLATVTDTGQEVRAARAAVDRTAMRDEVCRADSADVARAQPLLEGRYEFLPHPPVTLGTDLTWAEDPLDDSNWQFQLHTLRWLWPLLGAWAQTGEQRYLDHAYDMARSWVKHNPLDDPPSRYSWDDHSTAWRAMVLGCLSMHGEVPPWLADAMATHARLLADPDFYVDTGNHALNQDTGLLTLACLADRWDARDLAAERIAGLATTSIDEQGVTDEQATEYQDYNYERYLAAWHLTEACGLPTPNWSPRLQRMPIVLAHMVQPDGRYVTLGDTDRRRAKFAFEHPAMRWMSTAGDSGEPPQERFLTLDAGFTLARSGWGVDRPRLEE
ncbi:MAG: S-layer homology domain-containing protein, partial [Nitriliruptoraceae bacterium]